MRLTYWHASYTRESHRNYDIRTKTKREAVAVKAEQPECYGPITKIVVEYADGFDLMCMAASDGIGERDY